MNSLFVLNSDLTGIDVRAKIPSHYQGSTSLINASFDGAGGSALYNLTATRGYLAGNGMSTSYTLAGPTLPGFLAAWAPAAPLVETVVSMFGSNLTATPTAGTSINFAIRIQ